MAVRGMLPWDIHSYVLSGVVILYIYIGFLPIYKNFGCSVTRVVKAFKSPHKTNSENALDLLNSFFFFVFKMCFLLFCTVLTIFNYVQYYNIISFEKMVY